MKWISVENSLPRVYSVDYKYLCSYNVLFTDGRQIYLGYYQAWEMGGEEKVWKVADREPYTFEGTVTHWMPLPKLPRESYSLLRKSSKGEPNMKITLKVDNKGNQSGTLGWLCENAHEIRISTTKNEGKLGAWLLDKKRETITVLAVVNFYNNSGYSVDRVQRYDDGTSLCADRDFTDAAWEAIERIVDHAERLLQEPAEKGKAVDIVVKEK